VLVAWIPRTARQLAGYEAISFFSVESFHVAVMVWGPLTRSALNVPGGLPM
jgi:hypothetical protein